MLLVDFLIFVDFCHAASLSLLLDLALVKPLCHRGLLEPSAALVCCSRILQACGDAPLLLRRGRIDLVEVPATYLPIHQLLKMS